LFNLRERITAADDKLPKRLHEPLLKGPLSDKRLAEQDVQAMLAAYSQEQGWQAGSGAPLGGRLQALEIADYARFAPGIVPPDAGPSRLPPRVVGAARGA